MNQHQPKNRALLSALSLSAHELPEAVLPLPVAYLGALRELAGRNARFFVARAFWLWVHRAEVVSVQEVIRMATLALRSARGSLPLEESRSGDGQGAPPSTPRGATAPEQTDAGQSGKLATLKGFKETKLA